MYRGGKARKLGFTIIEVMLFLALTGLLLAGVLVGLGSNISKQRYNDAVEDVVDILQSQYAYVSDTHINMRSKAQDSSCYALVSSDITGGDASSYYNSVAASKSKSISYRGRTNCVVYGAVVTIDGVANKIQTTELIGRDYVTMAKVAEAAGEDFPENLSDLEILKQIAKANNVAVHCASSTSGCFVHTADNLVTNNLKWGVKLVNTSNNPLKATLLIFRSPRDGAIRTYVWNNFNTYAASGGTSTDYETMNNYNSGSGVSYSAGALNGYGIHQYINATNFKNNSDLKICVDSGDTQTYNQHQRMIKILHNGSGQSSVQLVEMDSQEASEQCYR